MPCRVLDFPPSGAPVAVDTVGPPEKGTIRWIDLQAQSDEDLRLLGDRFGFHPLTLEDCANLDQRPKADEYGGYLFVVMHGFAFTPGHMDEVKPLELHAFLGPDYLVTVHAEPMRPLDLIWQRAAGDAALGRRGADFLYYLTVDEVVDGNFALLDALSDELDAIEDAVIERLARTDLARIFGLKRTLVTLRRVLSPQRDVFAMLAKRGGPHVSEQTSLYFRDVYDHLTRIYESIDTGRDLLGNALDAYLSMVAQRTNEIMKRLTILSAVFLPLTFVTGFFGMNFVDLPIHATWLFYTVCVACLVVPAAMVFWFWKSGWF